MVADGVPHVVILLLHLASFGSILLLDLDGPEQILPDVLDVGGVSKGQNSVVFIHRNNSSDGLDVLLDDAASEWSVGLVASDTLPCHGVLFAAYFQRVEKSDLLFVGEG